MCGSTADIQSAAAEIRWCSYPPFMALNVV